jgi:hypothetical protein
MGVHIVLSKLNTELWIIQVCQAVKTALHTCFPCKISKNPFEQEREAPMPAKRLTVLKPFKVTGIDFARSLDVKRGIHLRKCCTELFTCMMVWALHLEFCSDVTTDTCFSKVCHATWFTEHSLHWQCADSSCSKLSWGNYGWFALLPRHTASSPRMVSKGSLSHQGGLVGENDRHHQTLLMQSVGAITKCWTELITTLTNTEATTKSRSIIQDTEETLTPAHFFCRQIYYTTTRTRAKDEERSHQGIPEKAETRKDFSKNISWN